MMKIHTTQDLNSLVQYRHSTNNKDFRFNYQQQVMPNLSQSASGEIPVAFKGLWNKKPSVKDGKKIVETTKKVLGDIKKEPNPEKKKYDKIATNGFFNWAISKHRFEPVIQAAVSAIICMALRPATIMALPAKDKENNKYASAHSFASGIMGLVSAILITTPFRHGSDYVKNTMRKNFSPEVLKRLYPQLNIESIWKDKAKNIRKPMEEWLDRGGNEFIDNINNIQFLAKFKQMADLSEETYSKFLKLDVDWASQKGKSFNDVVLKDGSKLYDRIGMSNLGIVVKEEGFGKSQILLRDIDKEFLSGIIKDAKEAGTSKWKDLDINSVYDKNNAVKDFREWKDINGNEWKLDLDEIYVSSPIEEILRNPRITGRKRLDKKSGEYKYETYFNNGINEALGTAIEKDIADSAHTNESIMKLLTWGPDIVTRIPVAAATIALIPWALKNVFGIEKHKKGVTKEIQVKNKAVSEDKSVGADSQKVAFKGKKSDPDKVNWFIKQFGKYYGKPIIESKKVSKFAEKLDKIPGELTQHMMTLGSLITSSTYMARTLNNKELDSDKKKTLAINQGLCFVIPTIAAYSVDIALNKSMKKFEYWYSNRIQHAIDKAKIEGKDISDLMKKKDNIKGVRVLKSICVFALIYRYLTPVLITPIANWIGDSLTAKRHAQKTEEKEIKKDNIHMGMMPENLKEQKSINSAA